MESCLVENSPTCTETFSRINLFWQMKRLINLALRDSQEMQEKHGKLLG